MVEHSPPNPRKRGKNQQHHHPSLPVPSTHINDVSASLRHPERRDACVSVDVGLLEAVQLGLKAVPDLNTPQGGLREVGQFHEARAFAETARVLVRRHGGVPHLGHG